MPSRRGWLALTLGALCLAATAVPISFSAAASATNENAHTLVLALPGPFNGCGYLDQGATSTSDSILDLVRPSAFVNAPNGVLVGQDGPIASAELTSLSPETVRYTIAPNLSWSNGVAFTGEDLVSWWMRARSLASVVSDGYRTIKSLVVATNGLTVTAVFATPYADWDLLFRDIDEPGATTGCALSNLVSEPSLGPYRVTSATPSRIVLAMNPEWPLDPNRFGRVVITDSANLPSSSTATFADYALGVNRSTVLALSTKPALASRITSSSNIEELTFSPAAATTDSLAVREALSWSLQRQAMIDQLFGAVTFLPSVAASAIFSQGQSNYPGGGGPNPVGQTTTTTTAPPTNVLSDCASCALSTLRATGYVRTSSGWVNGVGTKLTVRLGVGPSALDHSVALIVKSDWAATGIATTVVDESTEIQASEAAALGDVDVALLARPTMTTPAYAARSWDGPAYPDTYPSGVRNPEVTTLFSQASAIFNPVTAAATWLKLDQAIMTDFWVRPLFTAPSLTIWSSSLTTVSTSFTVAGFVDQLPVWSKVPTTATT
ncbi:MAG: ABC transporter substrate-binding protein [Acidimicrobiales bacterium]